jgi:hypothetical protein
MKVQIATPYRVIHLQRYGVTVRGNVTSVYPPLERGHWDRPNDFTDCKCKSVLSSS